ncbi:MAG: hypothetical protein AAGA18_10505 [Verrucomicrobiota bacterium]
MKTLWSLLAITSLVLASCSTTPYEERRERDGWSPNSVNLEENRMEPIKYKATF